MKAKIKNHCLDLSKPLDISIPIRGDVHNVNAWYVDHPKIQAHTNGKFVGSVAKGAPINFNDISFNPHAHGTHTECVGHITKEFSSVNQTLNQFFFLAEVITIAPEKYQDDFVISRKQLQYAFGNKKRDALIVRTLPNFTEKLSKQYSNSNPPYFLEEAAQFLVNKGVAHKAFWNFEGEVRTDATITEFIFVPNAIVDGTYYLNLQVAPFENDASPSRPVLYAVE